jgi:hypothetical protein
MEKEVLEKMIADRGKRSRQQDYSGAETAMGMAQQNQCPAPSGYVGERAMSEQERIVSNILDQRSNSTRSVEQSEKALSILREHPEFLDFIELIRTGCVQIY